MNMPTDSFDHAYKLKVQRFLAQPLTRDTAVQMFELLVNGEPGSRTEAQKQIRGVQLIAFLLADLQEERNYRQQVLSRIFVAGAGAKLPADLQDLVDQFRDGLI